MIRGILFAGASAGLVWISRKSLVRPGSHGFHRFFAWECLAALLLLVLPRWIDDPFSPRQLVAWTLITLSAYLALRGAYLLRTLGMPDPRRADAELFAFERTSRLVTEGLYGRIRHPLYSSLLFLSWGLFLKHPAGIELGLAAGASLFLVRAALADETECLAHFGPAYRDYMRRTRRFVPFLF